MTRIYFRPISIEDNGFFRFLPHKMNAGLLHGLEISLEADSPEYFKSQTGSGAWNPVRLFVEKIEDGTAVRLNNPFSQKERSVYHLLHWLPTDEFFVSVSRVKGRSDDPPSPVAVLKDVMPIARFCKLYGEIETKHYIRAGKKAHAKEGSDVYYAWRHGFLKHHDPAFYQDLKFRKIEVFITYEGDEPGQELHTTLGKPDVPTLFLEREGIHNAMHHPNFWHWFYKSIQEKGDRFVKNLERATGIFLRVIDETPIAISVPMHA